MLKKFVLIVLCSLFAVGVFAQDDAEITGPDRYPDGVNPLTGLEIDGGTLPDHRPLVIKISNWPPEVRPQSGVNAADLVWEYHVEGGVTRFATVFYTAAPEQVGPVRSARLADIPITRIYNALLVHSGSSIGTGERLATEIPNRHFGVGGCPPLCRIPREGVAIEHTLFGNVAGLYDRAEEEGIDTAPQDLHGMAFSAATPENGRGLNGIDLGYRSTTVQWDWDAASGHWLRSQDGEAHFDENDVQLFADNVAIIEADHIDQDPVREGYWGAVNYATQPILTGSGRLFLLRDGQYFEGEWRRADAESPLEFYDLAGNALPFKPGKTFINMLPRWFNGFQLAFDLTETGTASVTVDSAVLREGPSTNYAQLGSAAFGMELHTIGRNAAGDWVQIALDDGKVVWASTVVVDVDADETAQLPYSRSSFEG
jgi:hypothetical protein